MRYYPLSLIAQSPLLPAVHAYEVSQVYSTACLPQGAMVACNRVVANTMPCETPLAIIESVGAPMRRIYTEYPEFEDWIRLERAGFVVTDEFFGLMIDALH